MTEYTTQERWDVTYEKLRLAVAPPSDPVRRWLETSVPQGSGSCLELGCFPGRYLAVLGQMGYELHGIDRTPRLVPDLPNWLRDQGCRVGEFQRGDVFEEPRQRRYDVVCSFGLIEHFSKWQELLRRHAELVKPGGVLAVCTPNFRGSVQRLLHQWLDRANLAEHNLDAMQPQQWAAVVEPLGFAVQTCGFIGRFDFWVGPERRTPWQRALLALVKGLKPAARRLPAQRSIYAPYCGMVAQRAAA